MRFIAYIAVFTLVFADGILEKFVEIFRDLPRSFFGEAHSSPTDVISPIR